MSLFSNAPKLVLIDGSSYLYRAYYALPDLRSKKGEPSGALRGLLSMLRATLAHHPSHTAFVLDAPGPTFRDSVYARYKSNRGPMPADLVLQVEPMIEMVQALGFPLLKVAGVEADDVIGTLAMQAKARDLQVEISTGDKDFSQLVMPGICLVNTMTGLRTETKHIVAKYGVRPDQFRDYLALVGDSVDSIPGVSGCGPKTAAALLSQFGTIDCLMENLKHVRGVMGKKLKAQKRQLTLARHLVTIKTDVVMPIAPHDLVLKPQDLPALRRFYERFNFGKQ